MGNEDSKNIYKPSYLKQTLTNYLFSLQVDSLRLPMSKAAKQARQPKGAMPQKGPRPTNRQGHQKGRS